MKAGQNQQRTRYDGGEEVKGQGWEARNRSPIPTKSRRCNDVLGFVQRIEGLRENYNNSGGLFGSPGEKFPAEALSIKRGVKLRQIKRWNEGPLLNFTLITKEQRASTGWESPGGSVHEIISWRNIHQGQGDKRYCSKVVWMTQMTAWRRKELCSCHLDLSGCELTVDCPLRYQLGIEFPHSTGKSHHPPRIQHITIRTGSSNCMPGDNLARYPQISNIEFPLEERQKH